MPTRLETLIIVSFALILTAIIAMYGWWIGTRQSKIYITSLSDYLQVLSRSLADNASHLMVIREYSGLDERMLEAAGLPDVLDIQVMELNGTLLCNIVRETLSEHPRVVYRILNATPPAGKEAMLYREEDRLVSYAPITAGTHLGWLKMTISLHTAAELQSTTWRNSLLIGLFWVLVGTLLIILVVRPPLRAI